MSWSNVFRSSVGHKIVSKEERARQEGYNAGYEEGKASALVAKPSPLHRDMEALRQAELRGYVKALEHALWAVEKMPSRTGRKQILAVIEEQLSDKKSQVKEYEAREVRGD